MPIDAAPASEGRIARCGLALAEWSERWFPEPFIFALLGVAIVFAIGVGTGEKPTDLAFQAGKNFWSFVPFTMQMVMVIIGGYIVATAPLVRRAIQKLAGIPQTPRAAIGMVALCATLTSLISWGLSPIFCCFLVREMTGRAALKGLDYRAAGAAAYLGAGSVWAMGLSSSAAMLMATKSSMPPALFAISGLIPLTQTLLLWQSIVATAVIVATSTTIAYLSAPSAQHARTIEHFGIQFGAENPAPEVRTKPGEWLEFSPILTICVAALSLWYLADVFRTSPQGALAALDLNIYNLIFLTAGLLLHWRPRHFLRAVGESIPAVGGVLIQFPFYAMIFGMIVGTGLSAKLAGVFISFSTHETFGLLAGIYSAVLGFFVPSGGTKWIIEAPYVLQAAIAHQVHLGWVVQIYNLAEALPNLINPFWMLPLLGILKLRARDLIGYTMLQFVVNVPIVLFLCWLFARNIPYVPPMK
ncbi:MAG TPA: TIGR00366 family protein [Bryobacteraceae bacterium]|nr:TIGR00366 family protein [Bryobacteraceae bacterium]